MREVKSLLAPNTIEEVPEGLALKGFTDSTQASRLAYFSEWQIESVINSTSQAKLERVNGGSKNKQSTRYSSHGIHEYKGKFNPQVVRAILNILNISSDSRVLDPFCGSGTSLIECAHLGIEAVGTDINPLAVYLANAKLSALTISSENLLKELGQLLTRYGDNRISTAKSSTERDTYLKNWFSQDVFIEIEKLKRAIEECNKECAPIFFLIASNLLREYSMQDPVDLRIRRRKTPLPVFPLIEAFERDARQFLNKISDAKSALNVPLTKGKAVLLDSREMALGDFGIDGRKFDCAITSPPYATALPYIDTQRLSLVWLGLIPPKEIQVLESTLIGSREFRGEKKDVLVRNLLENREKLPEGQANYCIVLQKALSANDGFRRAVVPLLLYRYFVGMSKVLESVKKCVIPEGSFALIVGTNHTTLGGKRFEIDTPAHIVEIATSKGWSHQETVKLQTYQRYGYNASNAVRAEGLILLKNEK